jgi:hypothetical protein
MWAAEMVFSVEEAFSCSEVVKARLGRQVTWPDDSATEVVHDEGVLQVSDASCSSAAAAAAAAAG